MSAVVLRHATRTDVDALIAEPLPYRIRAFAAERDGELLGVGGLAFLPDGTVGAFVHVVPGARRYRVALHKAGLRTMALARQLGVRRVVALAEPGVEPACRWLHRLGFREMTVDGEQVFAWQTP